MLPSRPRRVWIDHSSLLHLHELNRLHLSFGPLFRPFSRLVDDVDIHLGGGIRLEGWLVHLLAEDTNVDKEADIF